MNQLQRQGAFKGGQKDAGVTGWFTTKQDISKDIYIYIYVHGHHLYMLKMHFEQCNIVNWKKDENKTCIKKAPS